MANITRGTSRGQLIGLPFGQVNVTASQTDVQLPVAAVSGAVDGYDAMFDGEIVGVAYALSAAGTTGAFTIGPTIDGTENTTYAQTVGTTTKGRIRIPRGAMRFTAGQKIGAEITTAAGWDGTTSDLSVTVYVIYQMDGI